MNARGITGIEGPGISKLPIFLSIVVLCWMENVWSWAKQVFMKTVLSMIGNIRITIFVSSTCVTVHKLQDPEVVVDVVASCVVLAIAA